VDNHIYFNELVHPQQFDGTVEVLQLGLQKDFRFGKIKFNNAFWWQSTSETAEIVLRLPEWLVHSTLIYESWVFDQKLLGQVGLDLHYTSAYYANAFDPATAQFYLQNDVQTNGYPLFDFFISFKIKTARVYLKMHNAGDDLFGETYYQTPHYPMPGRIFQFGFKWRFFD
jgi:hypothetical protein